MDTLPEHVRDLIYDYAYGGKDHWKKHFKSIVANINEISACKLINDYFSIRYTKNGLHRAIEMCLNHIDYIGAGCCEDIIMNNILEEMRLSKHRYYDKVLRRFKHLQHVRDTCC